VPWPVARRGGALELSGCRPCDQPLRARAGQTETVILRKLAGADPEGKRHCVRLLRTFEYRHHLCLVFESMARPDALRPRLRADSTQGAPPQRGPSLHEQACAPHRA